MDLFPPHRGFSRGTKQGLLVAIPLLIILIGITLLVEVRGQSPLSVSLDVLASICLAIVAVWVVGGMFELEGRFQDISVKAAGGLAVMLFIATWVRPYYGASSYAPNPISITLPANAPLRFIYDEIIARNGTSDTPTIIRFKSHGQKVLALRPKPVDQSFSYTGSNWLEIFRKLASQAQCLSVEATEDQRVVLGIDISRIQEIGGLVTCKE